MIWPTGVGVSGSGPLQGTRLLWGHLTVGLRGAGAWGCLPVSSRHRSVAWGQMHGGPQAIQASGSVLPSGDFLLFTGEHIMSRCPSPQCRALSVQPGPVGLLCALLLVVPQRVKMLGAGA